MGPPLHNKIDETDSDEETDVRHDRFKSERFHGDYTVPMRQREEKYKPPEDDKYRNKRYRDRSPPRTYKHRRNTLQNRNETWSNNDIKERNKRHQSKSSNSLKNEMLVHDKKHVLNQCEQSGTNKTNAKKLSSLLINFDKQVESKRKLTSESLLQVGPALPSHLKVDGEKECVSNQTQLEEPTVGPAIPPLLKNDESNFNPVSRETSVELPTELKNQIINESIEEQIKPEATSTEGPALPPLLQNRQIPNRDDWGESERIVKNNLVNSFPDLNSNSPSSKNLDPSEPDLCPVLPPNIEPALYGPSLPPKIESNSYGPALPPNFKKEAIQGPALPTDIAADQLERMLQEESEDEDMVGPLPEGKMNMTQYQLDLRAMDLKRKLEDEKSGPSKDITKREEWMLELPPEKATNLGLGPRSFRMREAPDMSNRSSWTDTPAEKLRKEEQALRGQAEPLSSEEVMRTAFVRERNAEMEKISQLSHNENRQESLLETHQKKLKKKKKKEEKEGKKKERRPFDRNIDLQVNRFDEAQKKAIFKKAQLLDTRFSSGESKYL